MKLTRLLPLFAALLALCCPVACSKSDDGGSSGNGECSASLSHEFVIWPATGSNGAEQVRITSEGDRSAQFVARIVQGADFCSFEKGSKVSEKAFRVGQMGVYLYLDANRDEAAREVKIRVTFSDRSPELTLTLIQNGYSSSASYDKQRWPERPQYRESTSYVYKTYFTTLANVPGKVRNYSICYDISKRVSLWVAYPVHDCYMTPRLNRPDDAWAYDPNEYQPYISQADQQYILQSYGSGYQRGHMLPSATRYSTVATNAQTFYATNMMPQNATFNGGVWAKLEQMVRDNSSDKTDTLYVVTGTYFADNKTIVDRKDKQIAVPSHAYKVLLKARKPIPDGKTIADLSADELQAIGFWFSNTSSNPELNAAVCSVAEIEAKTNFSYFPMLPDNVARQVKQQKRASDWKGL